MPPKDSRLYWRAWTGSGVGFVTFGWDAGVLGGIISTPSFHSAMHVGILFKSYHSPQEAKMRCV